MNCGKRGAWGQKRLLWAAALLQAIQSVPAPAHSGANYRGVIAIHGCRSAIIESADPVHVLARTEVDEGDDVLEDAYRVMQAWFGIERHEIMVRQAVPCTAE